MPVNPSFPVLIRVDRRPRNRDSIPYCASEVISELAGIRPKSHPFQVGMGDELGNSADATSQKRDASSQTLDYGIRQVVLERRNDCDAARIFGKELQCRFTPKIGH